MILLASLAIIFSLSPNESEIDLFMREVLENQKAAQAALTQYIFTEEESLEVRNGNGSLQESRYAGYVWFAREGKLVRSPNVVDGSKVGESDRLAYEDFWLNGGKKGKRRADIAEDSFFNFTYEPGQYFFAGREERGGRSIVLVEYYPREHFTRTGRDPIGSQGDDYDPSFDKTSMVLFHVDELDRQITQIDFKNIALDYLPSSWLIAIDDFRSTFIKQRTENGAWIPARLELNVKLSQAEETFTVRNLRIFSDFKRAGVKIDFSVPAEERIPK